MYQMKRGGPARQVRFTCAVTGQLAGSGELVRVGLVEDARKASRDLRRISALVLPCVAGQLDRGLTVNIDGVEYRAIEEDDSDVS